MMPTTKYPTIPPSNMEQNVGKWLISEKINFSNILIQNNAWRNEGI
jgi:hypothetical protein